MGLESHDLAPVRLKSPILGLVGYNLSKTQLYFDLAFMGIDLLSVKRSCPLKAEKTAF